MSLDTARREAARVAAHVDLRDVRLWGVTSELINVPDDERTRLSYSFNADLEVQHSSGSDVLLVLGNYSLAVRSVPLDQDELTLPSSEKGPESEDVAEHDLNGTGPVATVTFSLNALFVMEDEPAEDPFSEAELTAFGNTTGQFALYPYARELVADMTGRMGLPALHLGVMRLALETREG